MRPRLEICIDCADPLALAPFWTEALGYRRGSGNGDPYIDLDPPDGNGPTIFLQRVPEPKQTKNRLHIDLYVADPDPLVDRLVALGARPAGDPVLDGSGEWSFQVMADPEGNEFCVCMEEGGS